MSLDLQPTTILAFIFSVLVAKHVVALVGKPALVERAWTVYAWLASRMGHPKFKELAAKRQELVKVGRERRAVSAQDQYAKWTKLNRSFDKLTNDVNALAAEVSSEKSRVGKFVGFGVAAFTTAPIWFSRYWYRKVVLLYFPPGVFPPAVEWCLALPFTVTGGLGLTGWMFAVNSVLSSLTFLVKYAQEPAVEKPVLVSDQSGGAAAAKAAE